MTDHASLPTPVILPISTLTIRESNPNVMDEEQYRLLVNAIRTKGFLQPILVRPMGDRFEVIDGAHRVQAAGELGLDSVLAVVRENTTDEDAAILQIGMNRMRGEVDIGRAAESILELVNDGWSVEDLTLTGFSEEELDAIIQQARTSTEDVLAGAQVTPPATPDSEGASTLPVLELEFSTPEDLKRAKRALRKAAGKGQPLSLGLLRLIDGETS